jgi:hypothetical protein
MILDRSPHADVDAMWDELRDAYGVSEQTLQVVTSVNGYSRQTMEDVLYAVTGLRSFGQGRAEEEEDDSDYERCEGFGGSKDPRCGRKIGHDGCCDWVE